MRRPRAVLVAAALLVAQVVVVRSAAEQEYESEVLSRTTTTVDVDPATGATLGGETVSTQYEKGVAVGTTTTPVAAGVPLADALADARSSGVVVEPQDSEPEEMSPQPEEETSSQPVSESEPAGCETLAELLEGRDELRLLTVAFNDTGVNVANLGPGITLFAPTNEAFAAFVRDNGKSPAELFDDREALGELLAYHVLDGVVSSGDMRTDEDLDTASGAPVRVISAGANPVLAGTGGGNATVSLADALGKGCASAAHIIDAVLQP